MIKRVSLLILFFAAAVATAEELPRTITVTGTGFTELAPDKATVYLSILVRHQALDAAQKGAAEVTHKVFALAEELDIDRDHIDTTGASVQPDYHWNRQTEEQELRGYIAQRRIVINVDELDVLGELIEGAVKAGVNQVSPPQLDSSKRRDAYRKALAAAAEDARKNAAVLAATLGAELGDVISIGTGQNIYQPHVPIERFSSEAAFGADAAQSYNPADLTFNATVTAVFELAAAHD